MTIAAGFVCTDGLLFASDTLYSGEENRYGEKFWQVLLERDVCVVFGGAGTEAGLKRTRDELQERLPHLTTPITRSAIVDAIEDVLLYVEKKLAPAEHERTVALVGIRIGTETRLFENQGGKAMLSPIDYNSQCVGAGHSLGLYFARSLFTEPMPIAWAKVVAAHLVKNVKQFSSGWCGGETYLFGLPAVGHPWHEEEQQAIRKLEVYLEAVENAYRLVLPGVDTPDERTLTMRLKKLRREIKKIRSEVVVESGGSPSLTLGEWLEDSSAT
jgi:hypothetical protein